MKVENVNVIDPAIRPGSPVKPRPKLNMAIAGALGLMVSLGIVFVMEYLDNTIKTPEQVTELLALPVLGTIPRIDVNKEQRRVEKMQRREAKKNGAEQGVEV